jgi:glycosyltransferase involved in cell wall biosynthesis
MTTIRIYPIPYRLRGNEYLERIYGCIPHVAENDTRLYIESFSFSKTFLRALTHDSRQIVHVHWETNIYGSAYVLVSIIRGAYRFAGFFLLKSIGVKFVWTMHNLHAHDYPHPRIDSYGQAFMRLIADTIIIQEPVAARAYSKHVGSSRVISIPHPHWIEAYGERFTGDRAALRDMYGFTKDDIVIIALGSIRPYKNIPYIIDAVCRAQRINSHIRLLIAGKGEPGYIKNIKECINNTNGIVLKVGFVSPDDIPKLLALADYSIFYFDHSSLTSGALILSLSYGTPAIARVAPPSDIILEGENGFTFVDKEQLETLLASLSSKQRPDTSDVIASVVNQSPESVAFQLASLYIGFFKAL